MTGLIQLALLCLLGSALYNAEALTHWALTHKPYGVGSYWLMSGVLVAAVTWFFGSLGELL